MKLSTFIFLCLICTLFDLNFCLKSKGNKHGKNGILCKNFCEQEIISTDGKTINLVENNLKRYKRSPRGELNSKKKSWLEKLCCCGGGDEDDDLEEAIARSIEDQERQKQKYNRPVAISESQDPPSSSQPQDLQHVEGKGKGIATYVSTSSSSSDDGNLFHREGKALIKGENIGSTSSPVQGKKAV